jgi:redox-sensitive bicupin YhaK (pirin superfamily)
MVSTELTMKQLSFIKRSNGSHWVGDGFPVRNMFSYNDIHEAMSPFLMLDYAGPAHFEPTSQRRGVGSHPHRGIETVSIVYSGEVSHRDSSGGGGTIGPGDVQWMTAAGGLVHEEFHSEAYARSGGPFEMIQLWVNLPAKDKMSAPGYQGITASQIPCKALPDHAGEVRVIAGKHGDAQGPASTFSPMNVWDVRLNAGANASFTLPAGHTCAIFVAGGALAFGDQTVGAAEMAVMEREGDTLQLQATQDCKLLLMSGQPLNEPIVGYGPFVMNTEQEIHQAFADFRAGKMGAIS